MSTISVIVDVDVDVDVDVVAGAVAYNKDIVWCQILYVSYGYNTIQEYRRHNKHGGDKMKRRYICGDNKFNL